MVNTTNLFLSPPALTTKLGTFASGTGAATSRSISPTSPRPGHVTSTKQHQQKKSGVARNPAVSSEELLQQTQQTWHKQWRAQQDAMQQAWLQQHGHQDKRASSPPSSRPVSASAAGISWTRPDIAYSTPPAVVGRSYGGLTEGQLMYQLGKVAPVLPTYSPYWLRDPPQRRSVTDLRLQPSQRSTSCYSPEFIVATKGQPDAELASQAPTPASAGSRPTSPAPGHSRPLASRPTTAPAHRSSSVPAGRRPTSSPVYASSPSARPTTSSSAAARWAGRRVASARPGSSSTRSQPAPATGSTYAHNIKRGLAASPLTEAIRAQALSTFATGMTYSRGADPDDPSSLPVTTIVKKASHALSLSRCQSRCASGNGIGTDNGGTGGVVGKVDAIHGYAHDPAPTETQLRVPVAMSHESGPVIPFKRRLAVWGV